MPAIITNQFRIEQAKKFYENLTQNIHYVYFGGVLPWQPDDNIPPTPFNSYTETQIEFLRDAILAKRIVPSEVSHVIRRNEWTPGVEYDFYDTSGPSFSTDSIVITDELRVYVCIDKPDGQVSTVKPTGTSPDLTIFSPLDRYRWKFLYELTPALAELFFINRFMPVKNVPVNPNDGSLDELQFDVQSAAIPGGVLAIKVTNPGQGYTSAPLVTVTGDGTGLTATAVIASGRVSHIIVTNPGTGYTFVNVTLTGGGGINATAKGIIPPKGGYGADMIETTNAFSVAFSTTIDGDEGGVITVANDFRKVGIIEGPLLQNDLPAEGVDYSLTTEVTFNNLLGDIQPDQVITQPATGATATIVEVDAIGGVMQVTNIKGTFNNSVVNGVNPNFSLTVTGTTPPLINKLSGKVHIIDNRAAIFRASDQTENVRLIAEF